MDSADLSLAADLGREALWVAVKLSFPILLPGGRRRILRGSGVPVLDDDGHVVRIDGFAQDITELARAAMRQGAVAMLGRMALSGVPMDVLLRLAA